MAKILKDKKIQPDLLISSTAKRAISTAKEFAKALGYKKHGIIREPKLYGADTGELLQFTKNLKEELISVMIFGHNPGLTYFVNLLAQTEIDNLPTCGIVAIRFDIKLWNEVNAGKGSLEFFEYPRLYFPDLDD